jgi:hypothetical protein
MNGPDSGELTGTDERSGIAGPKPARRSSSVASVTFREYRSRQPDSVVSARRSAGEARLLLASDGVESLRRLRRYVVVDLDHRGRSGLDSAWPAQARMDAPSGA